MFFFLYRKWLHLELYQFFYINFLFLFFWAMCGQIQMCASCHLVLQHIAPNRRILSVMAMDFSSLLKVMGCYYIGDFIAFPHGVFLLLKRLSWNVIHAVPAEYFITPPASHLEQSSGQDFISSVLHTTTLNVMSSDIIGSWKKQICGWIYLLSTES